MTVRAAQDAVREAEAALASARAGLVEEREEAGYGLTVTIDELVGSNLSAGEIMDVANQSLVALGATSAERSAYRREAISGNYEHLCAVTRRWLTEGPPGGWAQDAEPEDPAD